MGKQFKSKKKRSRIKYLLFICLFIITFIYAFKSIEGMHLNLSNEEFLRVLLKEGNVYEKKEGSGVWSKVFNFMSAIDIKNPVSIIAKNYSGMVENDSSSDGIKDVGSLNNNSDYIRDPYPDSKVSDPLVYIYNTHQLEEYSTANVESYNVKPNVMMASYILREKLNKFDIPTLVEENDVTEFLKTNNWNYASSYKVTKMLMEDAKEKNSTLKFFIDLHRDSVNKKISTANINGQNYAKILFIVGLENPNYKENLEVTKAIDDDLKQKYPGISRGVYEKEGKGVNGVYNQDFGKFTILVEMGGEENTIEEVLNSTEALATVLKDYIGSVK